MHVDQAKVLHAIANIRCVNKQRHAMMAPDPDRANRTENRARLLLNAPISAFFALSFLRTVLATTTWDLAPDSELEETGDCARYALTLIGVQVVQDILGKKEIAQASVIPGEKAKPRLTLEQIAFAPTMSPAAAALTLDLLAALGHTIESKAESWNPPRNYNDEGRSLLAALAIPE